MSCQGHMEPQQLDSCTAAGLFRTRSQQAQQQHEALFPAKGLLQGLLGFLRASYLAEGA